MTRKKSAVQSWSAREEWAAEWRVLEKSAKGRKAQRSTQRKEEMLAWSHFFDQSVYSTKYHRPRERGS